MGEYKTEQEGTESKASDAGEAVNHQDEGDRNFVRNIIDNYRLLEESIVAQLSLYYKHHGTETGTLREDIWLQLFEQIIPKKFCIEHSIFIIDSYGNKSREIDLAIVDQSYTPYIFQYGRLKFIPIEAVAAVIECKSTSLGDSIHDWLKAVNHLKTSTQSIARMATGMVVDGESHKFDLSDHPQNSPNSQTSTQTATRPIRILCGYQTSLKKDVQEKFDFCLIAGGSNNPHGIEVIVSGTYLNLEQWYYTLNHSQEKLKRDGIGYSALANEKYSLDNYKIMDGDKEVSLMSFNFLFNQLLMLINNPILFPHVAYANLFNRKTHSEEDGN